MVDQAVDRTGTRLCAKRTLTGSARTGVLLMGAALASVLAVDLPIPAGRAASGPEQPYVPTSNKWIDLGAASRSEPSQPSDPLQADLLIRKAAVDPAVAPARDAAKARFQRKPHRAQSRRPMKRGQTPFGKVDDKTRRRRKRV